MKSDSNDRDTREKKDKWLSEHCGVGIPYKDAVDCDTMLHGLAYVLRQIEDSRTYNVHIGQCGPAASALRMALDYFATEALSSEWLEWEGGECPVGGDVLVDIRWNDDWGFTGIPAKRIDWLEEAPFSWKLAGGK